MISKRWLGIPFARNIFQRLRRCTLSMTIAKSNIGVKILSRKWWWALYDDFPLRSYYEWIIEEKTNRREGKGKKPSDKYQSRIKKNIKNIISQQKKKDKVKRKKKNDDNKGKNRKDRKCKMLISQGRVTRPPSQFESYSLSASSKSYSGRSYSAPKPD